MSERDKRQKQLTFATCFTPDWMIWCAGPGRGRSRSGVTCRRSGFTCEFSKCPTNRYAAMKSNVSNWTTIRSVMSFAIARYVYSAQKMYSVYMKANEVLWKSELETHGFAIHFYIPNHFY
jgi:hypothetical protein